MVQHLPAARVPPRTPRGSDRIGAPASPSVLAALAAAWRGDAAWTGMTKAGGQELPAELAALIALDEVIVHGWDLAVASGQSFDCEPELIAAAYGFVQPTVACSPDGTPGLFGPPVPVAGDAAALEHLLGLTGRDPNWRPGAAGA